MTSRQTLLLFVLGLALVPDVSLGAERKHPDAQSRPTPVYTNHDLERVRPFRDELGARSVPAEPVPAHETTSAGPAHGARGPEGSADRAEAYWRREADKLRERLRRLADEREALRARMAQRRDEQWRARLRSRGSRASATDRDQALEARVASIERRMRDLEEDLADRARRAGALPGWLR